MTNDLKEKLKTFCEENGLRYDMLLREVYDEVQLRCDKENVASWLIDDSRPYTSSDVEEVVQRYCDNYDANLGIWDNIRNAFAYIKDYIPNRLTPLILKKAPAYCINATLGNRKNKSYLFDVAPNEAWFATIEEAKDALLPFLPSYIEECCNRRVLATHDDEVLVEITIEEWLPDDKIAEYFDSDATAFVYIEGEWRVKDVD